MKIAFILNSFPVITETFILNQITGIIDLGYEIDIFARHKNKTSLVQPEVEKYKLNDKIHYPGKLTRNKVLLFIQAVYSIFKLLLNKPVTIINSLKILKYSSLKDLLKVLHFSILFLDKKQYDIIHCHYGYVGIIGQRLKEIGIIKGKLVTTFYGSDLFSLTKEHGPSFYSNLFDKGDSFIALSKSMKNKLLELGCREEKIKIHHLGVDFNKFTPVRTKKENGTDLTILSIARLVPKKGIEYAIKVIDELSKKHSNIRYLVIGDGYLRNELEKLVSELNLSDRINLLDSMPHENIIDYLNQTDIFLAPSLEAENGDQEGTPVVILEALAMSIPVVATKHSGIPELVSDNETGFIVAEKNTEALIEKLSYLILNPELRNKFGQTGRSRIMKNFSINLLNRQLIQLYFQLSEN